MSSGTDVHHQYVIQRPSDMQRLTAPTPSESRAASRLITKVRPVTDEDPTIDIKHCSTLADLPPMRTLSTCPRTTESAPNCVSPGCEN